MNFIDSDSEKYTQNIERAWRESRFRQYFTYPNSRKGTKCRVHNDCSIIAISIIIIHHKNNNSS